MQLTLILCAVALTAAVIAFLVYAMRAVHQATLTMQSLDKTLAHTNETLESASEMLEGLDHRLERIDPAIDRLVNFGRLAGQVTDIVNRTTRGPVSLGAGLAMAAVEGFRAFRSRRSNGPQEVDGHEQRSE